MELFDVCDELGMPTGQTVTREEAHEKGILHRTAHVWVVKKVDDILYVLLQKRAMDKDSFPGCYDTSSAGHIQAGDEPLDSALRELQEELGIKAKEEELHFAGTFRIKYEDEFHGKVFRDNEVAYVYIYQEDVDIDQLHIQKEELDSVRWFGADSAYLAMMSHNPEFCIPVDGLNIVRHQFYPHCTHPAIMEAKEKIDEILEKYGPTCRIAFLRAVAIINDSYKIHSKKDRTDICKIIAESGITHRTADNLSAEWEVHNVAFDTKLYRSHAKDVDLDYESDPRFMVRLATNVFEKLHMV